MNAPIARPTPDVKASSRLGTISRSLLANISGLLGRRMWSQGLGKQFNGQRDLYEVYGYNKNPTYDDMWARYHRQDLAKRVVDAPADGVWTDPPDVNSEGSEDFNKAWKDVVSSAAVWMQLHRLDILAGLGPYAIMVVGFDDGRPLSQPVNVRAGVQRKVIYLQPYGYGSCQISKWDEDQTSPRFGRPVMYTVKANPANISGVNNGINRVDAPTTREFNVHWSRVLHVAENCTDNQIYGHPRMESIYNVFDDLMKVVGGSAETYWLTSNRGMQVDIDKDLEMDPDDEQALSDEITEFQHELRRFIRTRGIEIKELGNKVADPQGAFSVLINVLAGATGIPQRILLGAEAGQLASQQDRANWAQRIQERVTKFAEPVMLLPFIRMLIAANVLPSPIDMACVWPDAFKLNPLERAQTSAQMARSAANLMKALTTPIAKDGSGRADSITQQEMDTPETTDPVTGAKKPGSKTLVDVVTEKPSEALLSLDEARQIIGFGKHAPVFDDREDTANDKTPVAKPTE